MQTAMFLLCNETLGSAVRLAAALLPNTFSQLGQPGRRQLLRQVLRTANKLHAVVTVTATVVTVMTTFPRTEHYRFLSYLQTQLAEKSVNACSLNNAKADLHNAFSNCCFTKRPNYIQLHE